MSITNVKSFFDACKNAELFTEQEHQSLMLAIASRGKYAGMIRATIPPKSSPKARGVWQGIVSFCNTNRIVVASLIVGDPEEKEWYTTTESLISERFSPSGAARLFSYLEPLRWNCDFQLPDHSDEEKTQVLSKVISDLLSIKNLREAQDSVVKQHKE